MAEKIMRDQLLIFILSAFWLLFGVLWAQGQSARPWTSTQVFHTHQADLIADHWADLEELARRLGAVSPAVPGQPDLGLLADRIDHMVLEVGRVLQKRPLQPVRLQIRLLRDGFQVRQQQLALRVSPSPNQPVHLSLASYYEPRLRTIFLSLTDARLGVLVHEITHFILCESTPVPPNPEYQENLARYMEERFNAGR
jgi:hypothetical protein